MRKWTALYYPNVEPPIGWLRSAALLFDHVTSFVPRESEDRLSDELLRFAEKTDAWQPYRPDEKTADLVGIALERLDAAFADISAQRKRRPDEIEMRFVTDPSGRTRVQDFVFLHGTKMSGRIHEMLHKHGLLLPKVLAEPLRADDWWLADEKASDLLLAQIADNLAARQGWASLTDNEGCYTFTSLDSLAGPARVVESQLARLVIASRRG